MRRRRPRPMTRLMRKRQFVPSLRDRRDNPFCEDRQLRDMEDRAVRSHFLHDYGDSLPGPPRKLNEFRRQPAGASPKKRPSTRQHMRLTSRLQMPLMGL